MSGTIPPGVPDMPSVAAAAASEDVQTLALHAETVTLSKRKRRTLVRASRTTVTGPRP